VPVLVVNASVPRGWRPSPPSMTWAWIPIAYQGHASAFLKSKKPSVGGFGTLMQSIAAEQYLGKKARLSGLVKSEEVQGWAGLWMRVDKGTAAVAFDNMQDRTIKGATAWQRYEVVLQVPQDAKGISFGILLSGAG
jgi:hypothetical protein